MSSRSVNPPFARVSAAIAFVAILLTSAGGSSSAETTETVNYEEFRSQVERLLETARETYPSFAGLWADGTDAVHLAFQSNAPDKAQEARKRADVSLPVVPHTFRWSRAELQGIVDSIGDDLDEYSADGITIAFATVDVRRNLVVIGVDGSASSAEAKFAGRFGSDRIEVIDHPALGDVQVAGFFDPCTSRENCPALLRGGIDIRSTTHRCTSAFEAIRNTTNEDVLLTAGHCFPLGTGVNHWTTAPIGTVIGRQDWGDTDAESISQQDAVWDPTNWVYHTDSNRQRQINEVKQAATEFVGERVCKSGTTSGLTCGEITDTNAVAADHTGQTFADFCSLPGDSGAPIYRNSRGYGIVSMADVNYDELGNRVCSFSPITTYTPLERIELRLGVRVRTDLP